MSDNRTRFVKTFLVISDVMQLCVAQFLEDKQNSHPSMKTTIKENIRLKRIVHGSKTSFDLDITALCLIAEVDGVLEDKEKGSIGRRKQTVKDCIDRVRDQRNNIVHMADARLDEKKYEEHLTESNQLAEAFENFNKKPGVYLQMIKDIISRPLEEDEIERILKRFKVYRQQVIQTPNNLGREGGGVVVYHPNTLTDATRTLGEEAVSLIAAVAGGVAFVAEGIGFVAGLLVPRRRE